jgi:Tol biopolymer transport system component
LTLDERNDLPTAWTPDGAAVFFHSDRSGKWEIWKQRITDTRAELLVSGPGDSRGARISPDGRWLYYLQRPRAHHTWEWLVPGQLVRTSLTSGPPHTVLQERTPYSFRCTRAPSQSCVIAEPGWNQISFSVLDPERGKGPGLPRVSLDAPLDHYHWDISPDGSRIAVVVGDSHGSGRIRLLDLSRGTAEDITVDGRSGFQSIDWAPDGQGWYISSGSAQGAQILYVDQQGRAQMVRDQPRSFGTWAVPSPDGQRLAILEWSAASNAWMLEGF